MASFQAPFTLMSCPIDLIPMTSAFVVFASMSLHYCYSTFRFCPNALMFDWRTEEMISFYSVINLMANLITECFVTFSSLR